MRQKMSCMRVITVLAIICLIWPKTGFCYNIPSKESNIKYLYVFGKDGKKGFGARKEPQVLFFRVPASYKGEIKLSIYDPDVGGAIDEKSRKWNTQTRFSIFSGKEKGELLQTETFAETKKYDKKFYYFSPIDINKGEKIGEYRYFRFVAEGLSGDDNNLFSLEVSPDVVETFSYTLSLRLSEQRGTKMRVYPEIPPYVTNIIEYNYDVDEGGGDIELIGPSMSNKIETSKTGVWVKNKIDVPSIDTGKRWSYEITKGTQPNANMAVYLTTGDGEELPIFFTSEGAVIREIEPELLCNTFTFDASKSYDPDNQKLSFLWDFGDGATSNEVKTRHTYKDVGKYVVKLTVTDDSSAECNMAVTQQIVKVNQPPQAVAEGPMLSCVNSEVTFDAGKTKDTPGDKLTYIWDFGNGDIGEGIKVKYRYAEGGNYQVTLTVKDDSGTTCDTGVAQLNLSINTPPVADAGKDVVLCKKGPNEPLEVLFDASNSKDIDGDRLTYTWDFGDGVSEEGKVVTHTYDKGGRYVVRISVVDNTGTNCDRAMATRLVTLNRAPMANAGEDMMVCLRDEVQFDAGLSLDGDGDPLTCSWDFGDGETANGGQVSHRFAKGGIYKVRLTVNDNSKTECSEDSDVVVVDVNSSPFAKIEAGDNICVGEKVGFDGSSSSDPDGDSLVYSWDFGDGSTESGANVKHSYSKGGLYKVSLSVDDGRGLDCSNSRRTHYINVNTPPIADAGSDKVVCVNKEIQFDASNSSDADNDKLNYVWDFGDGVTQEGLKPSHSYKDIGVYKAILTVTDDSGTECDTSSDSIVVTVNAPPVPVMEVTE